MTQRQVRPEGGPMTVPWSDPRAQALREAFLAAVAAEDYPEADRIEAQLVALTGRRVPPYEVPAPAIQVWPPTTTEREEQE